MAVRITGTHSPSTLGRPKGRAEGLKAEKQRSTQSGESVDHSRREAAVATVKAKRSPEVDEARVAQLREAITKGEYRPDFQRVAEEMIREASLFG